MKNTTEGSPEAIADGWRVQSTVHVTGAVPPCTSWRRPPGSGARGTGTSRDHDDALKDPLDDVVELAERVAPSEEERFVCACHAPSLREGRLGRISRAGCWRATRGRGL